MPAPFTPMHESLNTSCAVKQNGDDSAPLTIVVGSSHALQMTAAFEPIAQRTGTNQMNLLETGCPLPIRSPRGLPQRPQETLHRVLTERHGRNSAP